jgi:6-phosphogluconolactonase
MAATMHAFASGADLAAGLADRVAEALSAAITARGSASIAVSGGSTPKAFFQVLSSRSIAWDKVTITLVDERFVPPDNPRSNHLLVKANLLQDKAAAARFLPLYQPAEDAAKSAVIASAETRGIDDPFDVVIVGMGGDGHTASFFPGGNNLKLALDPNTPRGIVTMEAEGAGEPRLTFTFASLQDARLLVLHIEGEGKKDTLAKAEQPGPETDMPIRAILRRAVSPLEIYWAP